MECVEDDDPFSAIPKPVSPENLGNVSVAAAQRLPRNLKGVVVDVNDNPVKRASITLTLYRSKDLFEANDSNTKETWNSLTNEEGIYNLQLDKVVAEPDDDLVLQVDADQYLLSSSTIPLKEMKSWKLPRQVLSAKRVVRSREAANDSWAGWKNDTDVFNRLVAATVNGVPVLNGQVIGRHSKWLMDYRMQMQNPAINRNRKFGVDGPEEYEKRRVQIIQRELAAHIVKVALVEYLMARLTPRQRTQAQLHVAHLFEKEVEKLQREWNAANPAELATALQRQETTLNEVNEQFSLDCLSEMCLAFDALRFVPISEREVHDYYESHRNEFESPETVDWRQISFELSATLNVDEAKPKLEELLERLNRSELLDDRFEIYAREGLVLRKSWTGTSPASIASRDLRSQLSTAALNRWTLVIDNPAGATADRNTAPDVKNQPSTTLLVAGENIRFSNARFGAVAQSVDANSKLASVTDFAMTGLFRRLDGVTTTLESSDEAVVVAASQTPGNTTAPAAEQVDRVHIFRVSKRYEASRTCLEEVRVNIREKLDKKRAEKFRRILINTIFAAAKIESSYTLPPFMVDDRVDDPQDVPALNSKTLPAPFEQTFESMNDDDFDRALNSLRISSVKK